MSAFDSAAFDFHAFDADAGVAPVDPGVPFRGSLVRLATLYGLLQRTDVVAARLALVGSTHGSLQQIGPIMIDIIGPISVHRGDSLSLRITVTDDDGARINLTGYAIELEVKPTIGGVDPATIAKAVGSGITILAQSGATTGQADAVISSDDTDVAAGLYWLDVVTISGGVRTHVIAPTEFTVRGVVNAPS